jgi:hypothetical protein
MSKPPYVSNVESQGAIIRLYEKEHDHEHLYLTVRTKQGAYEQIQKLTVTATNEEKNIGPIEIATTNEGVEYSFPGLELSPPGNWELSVTATRPNAYDVVGVFPFRYPFMDHTGHVMKRTFDDFAGKISVAGLISLILAFGMWKKTAQTAKLSIEQKKTA